MQMTIVVDGKAGAMENEWVREKKNANIYLRGGGERNKPKNFFKTSKIPVFTRRKTYLAPPLRFVWTWPIFKLRIYGIKSVQYKTNIDVKRRKKVSCVFRIIFYNIRANCEAPSSPVQRCLFLTAALVSVWGNNRFSDLHSSLSITAVPKLWKRQLSIDIVY